MLLQEGQPVDEEKKRTDSESDAPIQVPDKNLPAPGTYTHLLLPPSRGSWNEDVTSCQRVHGVHGRVTARAQEGLVILAVHRAAVLLAQLANGGPNVAGC